MSVNAINNGVSFVAGQSEVVRQLRRVGNPLDELQGTDKKDQEVLALASGHDTVSISPQARAIAKIELQENEKKLKDERLEKVDDRDKQEQRYIEEYDNIVDVRKAMSDIISEMAAAKKDGDFRKQAYLTAGLPNA